MSLSITNYILPAHVSSNESFCLHLLQEFSYKYGYAFPGYELLAKKMHISIATLKRVIARLKELNFIIVERQGRHNATIKINYEELNFYHPTFNPYTDNNMLSTNSVDKPVEETKELDQNMNFKVSSVIPPIVNFKVNYNNIFIQPFKKQPEELDMKLKPYEYRNNYTMPEQKSEPEIEKQYLTENRKKFKDVMESLKGKKYFLPMLRPAEKQNLSSLEPLKQTSLPKLEDFDERLRPASVFKHLPDSVSLDDVMNDYFSIDE